jgi:mannose/fructose-specific phosphotransferase system component IIA
MTNRKRQITWLGAWADVLTSVKRKRTAHKDEAEEKLMKIAGGIFFSDLISGSVQKFQEGVNLLTDCVV